MPFSDDRVKLIVASIIGMFMGAVSVQAFAAGLTWAIGRVFMQYFASGGTFLDFDPAKVREHF